MQQDGNQKEKVKRKSQTVKQMEIETELEGVKKETGQPADYYTHYCTSIDTTCPE